MPGSTRDHSPDPAPAGAARRTGPLRRFRRKLLNPILFERAAARLYRDGLLVNDQDLTCEGSVFLAVVVIIRGEARFLAEWLEFHAMMGVDHFIVYDNGLEDETEQVLAPYVASRQVTRIAWPDITGLRRRHGDLEQLRLQELAYGNCVRRYRDRMEWLLKFDVDEFVFPVDRRYDTVADALRSLDRRRWLGLRVPQLEFGSSGHIQSPRGLVIENYTRCQSAVSRGTKSIANAEMIAPAYCVDPHGFPYRAGKVLRGKLTGSPRAMHRRVTARLLRLNHYRLKSREEYLRKGAINTGGWMTGKQTVERFESIDATHSEAENHDIQRFLEPLKNRLAAPATDPKRIATQ